MCGLLTLFLLFKTVSAEETTVQPALTLGVMELASISRPPAHLGLFVLGSLDLLIPVNEDWTIILSNGAEFAPDNLNWGGFSFVIFDRVIAERAGTTITIEPQLGIVHNAVPIGGREFSHALYPTAGVGVALIGENHTWIPTTTTSVGLQGEGLSQGLILYYSRAL